MFIITLYYINITCNIVLFTAWFLRLYKCVLISMSGLIRIELSKLLTSCLTATKKHVNIVTQYIKYSMKISSGPFNSGVV